VSELLNLVKMFHIIDADDTSYLHLGLQQFISHCIRLVFITYYSKTVQCIFCFQDKKVFTVSGPYPSLRAALRRRGWVEKINNASALTEATRLSANGNDEYESFAISYLHKLCRSE